MGFEPTIFGLEVQRVNPLRHRGCASKFFKIECQISFESISCFSELYRLITSLYEQCQRHISQLPKRAQLFSFSHDEFHPPANVSGIVDVADLEISVLFVDLLTLKHENSELRWLNERLVREKKVYKSKLDLYELTNKYFQSDFFDKNSTHELIRREKVLRLYVYRLYDLLETTSNQLKERQTHDENLLYQFRIRNRELTEQIRRFRR